MDFLYDLMLQAYQSAQHNNQQNSSDHAKCVRHDVYLVNCSMSVEVSWDAAVFFPLSCPSQMQMQLSKSPLKCLRSAQEFEGTVKVEGHRNSDTSECLEWVQDDCQWCILMIGQ